VAYYEDVKTSTIAYVGLVSVLTTFVLVLLLEVLYYRYRTAQTETLGGGAPPAALTDLVSQQQTTLTVPRIVDSQRGVVTIPVSRAMDLVVAELADGKSPAEVIGPPPRTGGPSTDKSDLPEDKEKHDDGQS